MKKNAFTLIELLAVLLILGILATITVPVVTKIISKAQNSTQKSQINTIERAAQTWFLRQPETLDSNQKVKVDVDYLVSHGQIEGDKVIDPKEDKEMKGCVVITFSSNQYKYKYEETDCTCSDETCIKYE